MYIIFLLIRIHPPFFSFSPKLQLFATPGITKSAKKELRN
jgi:hypothetical protein